LAAAPQGKPLPARLFPRTACARRAAQPCAAACSRRVEVRVNDIVNSVGTDYGCDGGDHAGSRVGPDSSRATLHGQAPVASDRGDEQAKHEALQYAGDDIANEQRIFYQIEKIWKRDAEIRFTNQAARKYS